MIVQPSLLNACLRVCAFALLVKIVSVCIPGWLISSYENINVKLVRNYAVWYMQECVTLKENPIFNPEKCTTEIYAVKLNAKRIRRLEDPMWDYDFSIISTVSWEVMTTVGIVCMIAASILLIKARQLNTGAINDPSHRQPSDALFTASAILATASVVLFCTCFQQIMQARPHHTERVARKQVPYGAIVALCGVVLAFCATALNVFMILKNWRGNQGSVLRLPDCQTDGQSVHVPMMAPQEQAFAQPPPPYQPPPSYYTYTTSPEYNANTRTIYTPQL